MDGSTDGINVSLTPAAPEQREPPAPPVAGALELYQKSVPEEFFQQLEQELGIASRRRLFTLPLVVWLMIQQRLDPKGTLSTAVQEVAAGRPTALLNDHKRIQEGTVSCNTGAYCEARRKLPLAVAEKVSDRVFDELVKDAGPALPGWDRQVFLLDGSTLLLPHTEELVEAYPPARNQHGESHWPVLRVLVGHDLVSGIATRPCWGPMRGPGAVSEQSLTVELLERLPPSSVVMGDSNFGVFSVAHDSTQRGHDVLLRLTAARAKRIGGGELIEGTDREVVWTPSPADRRAHPELPPEACVRGRFLVQRVRASNGKLVTLYLFATLDLPAEQIVELYGYRWNIEIDLRSLKRTVRLHTLSSKSVALAAKELVLGVTAYNFVRGVIQLAARRENLDPRRLSFSRAQDVVNAFLPTLEAAPSQEEYQTQLQRMFRYVAACRLPDRRHRRSTPRAVWGQPCVYPKRKPPDQR